MYSDGQNKKNGGDAVHKLCSQSLQSANCYTSAVQIQMLMT